MTRHPAIATLTRVAAIPTSGAALGGQAYRFEEPVVIKAEHPAEKQRKDRAGARARAIAKSNAAVDAAITASLPAPAHGRPTLDLFDLAQVIVILQSANAPDPLPGLTRAIRQAAGDSKYLPGYVDSKYANKRKDDYFARKR